MDPNIQVPYADTWTVGLQRGLTRNMAAEVRYVGTRSRQQWTTYNYNELNIIESGVLNEFILAQQNLQANLAAGRGGNFRYFGPGTGTHPLPTILGYFRGPGDPNNPAHYSSSLFQNATFLNPLAKFNPNPYTFGNNLDNNASRRANALAAGLPANLLRANPHKLSSGNNHGNSALVTGHGGFSDYNSVQFELRRRLAGGVQFDTSYVYGLGDTSVRYSFRVPRETRKRAGLTEGEVTHGFKMNWMLEMPFGQGRRFASNAGGVLDRIIGGWQVHGNARIQSGSWVDFGNVRMVGFNEKDLRKMFKLRINENQRVFMLPQDVIDETVKAFSTSPTSLTGYGNQGPAERPLLRAGHGARTASRRSRHLRRVRHAHAGGPRADAQGVRHQRRQDGAAREPGARGVPRRDAQRVQQRELRADRLHPHDRHEPQRHEPGGA
jgi:hypothetical protein